MLMERSWRLLSMTIRIELCCDYRNKQPFLNDRRLVINCRACRSNRPGAFDFRQQLQYNWRQLPTGPGDDVGVQMVERAAFDRQ